MTIENRILAFQKLGKFLGSYNSKNFQQEHPLKQAILKSKITNPWFTEDNVYNALFSISNQLSQHNLEQWLKSYSLNIEIKKRVAIIMAGNIPLVGFHDFLCVLISGHKAIIKLSSKDNHLLPALVNELINIAPVLKDDIMFVDRLENNFDAVIATGSNSSYKHFQNYFKNYPSLLRHSKTSVALLKGNESLEERQALAKDIFLYYGLGCRNVTKLYLPENYDLDLLFEVFYPFKDIILNHKYANNYDYYKAIYLMGKQAIIENGFLIMKKDTALHSPVAVLNYEFYSNIEILKNDLKKMSNDLQCIVGQGYTPFGHAQNPKLNDYADGLDTLAFLKAI